MIVHLIRFSLYTRSMRILQQQQQLTDDDISSTYRTHTYFVPTDHAFRKLGAATLQRLFDDPSYLRTVMNNHRADRIVPMTLIKRHRGWQFEIQTKNTIVRVAWSLGQRDDDDDKLMVTILKYLTKQYIGIFKLKLTMMAKKLILD